MQDGAQFEIFKTPDTPPDLPSPRRRVGLWIAVGVLVAATAAAAYFFFGRRQTAAPAERAAQGAAVPQQTPGALGGDAAPIDLPPLDETDPLVRDLLRQLSSHPTIAAWLATDGLIRAFTAGVVNVAEGKTPAAQLTVLRPSSPFRVIERTGNLYVDPRSDRRYDAIAAAVALIDPKGAARLYTTLKPRIEEAHQELGFPDTPVDRTLERAIVVLLGAPVLESPPRVEPRGVGYAFADSRLEQLSAAQKQLLRTGGQNVRIIQTALREVALALGIPADRLPPAR